VAGSDRKFVSEDRRRPAMERWNRRSMELGTDTARLMLVQHGKRTNPTNQAAAWRTGGSLTPLKIHLRRIWTRTARWSTRYRPIRTCRGC